MADPDSDQEALFAELENEPTSTAYAHQRIEQLNSELASRKNKDLATTSTSTGTPTPTPAPPSAAPGVTATLDSGSSVIPTLRSDQALLDATTRHPRCVVHFAHPDFARCATMDKHMERLARLHRNGAPGADARFLRIDPRDAPFVAQKLRIKVLPCVLGFVDGVVAERIVGFEGLAAGGFDADAEFRTASLERRLVRARVLLEVKVSPMVEEEMESGGEEELGSDEERNLGRRRTAIRGSRRQAEKERTGKIREK
ncbi:hypothetical protein KEM52_002952, partial [Ascosphaera acerosa]